MRRYNQKVAAVAAALLVGIATGQAPAADRSVEASACAIAAGGDVRANTLICNFGLTPEQFRQATEAAVTGATGPLLDRIEAISGKLGITTEAARTLLRIVGEQTDVPTERLPEVLTKVAQDYKRLQARAAALNAANPTAQDVVAQAKAEIEAGRLARAHELLRQATQVQIAAAQAARSLREQAQAAEDAQMLGAAQATATEGDVALTERRYAEAAALFAQATGYVPAQHRTERPQYLERQAEALRRQGAERGDNAALLQSMSAYRALLDEWPRDQAPLVWATMQSNLGAVLTTLGEREPGTAHLEEAVAAFRAALEEQTRDRAPLDWAMTQMNLGSALWRLSGREPGTTRLEQAVAAHRAALEEWTRDRAPLNWATAQTNLGIALQSLGDRDGDIARLEEAVAAHRAALAEWTRDRVPLNWAMAQTNLGSALLSLGGRETGTGHLEEAVAAFHAALEEQSRDRVPLDWASTQTGLGLALMNLGEREAGTARLEEALTAFDAALTVLAGSSGPDYASFCKANREKSLALLNARKKGIDNEP
jgi:tetratricopeptide (TPR) repeat protein